MLSLFRARSSLLGYTGVKLLFPSPLYFAIKASCYWLFSRNCTRETTCCLSFKCSLVGCIPTDYDVNVLFLGLHLVHTFPKSFYPAKKYDLMFTHSPVTFLTQKCGVGFISFFFYFTLESRRQGHMIHIFF